MKQFQNCSRAAKETTPENLLKRATQKKGTQPLGGPIWLRAGIVAGL
jgi:hypothetical protein